MIRQLLEDHFADVERIRNRRDSAHNLEEGEESDINSDDTVVSDIPDEDGRYSLGIDKFSVEQNNFAPTTLLVKAVQWQKDSHGLFDFDLRNITK